MSERVSTSSTSSATAVSALAKALKFIFISYIVSLALIMILAAVLVYTDIPESYSDTAIMIIELFAAFLSALLLAKNVGGKGWLCGFLTGGVNIIILLLLGSLLMNAPLFPNSALSRIACGALSGIVGGIVGVNLGDNS